MAALNSLTIVFEYIWSPVAFITASPALTPPNRMAVHNGNIATLRKQVFLCFFKLMFRQRSGSMLLQQPPTLQTGCRPPFLMINSPTRSYLAMFLTTRILSPSAVVSSHICATIFQISLLTAVLRASSWVIALCTRVFGITILTLPAHMSHEMLSLMSSIFLLLHQVRPLRVISLISLLSLSRQKHLQ